MKDMRCFFNLVCHSRIPRRAAVMLAALALCSLASCGRNHDVGRIHDAAQRGDLKKVKAILKDNPDLVFSKDAVGATPLHYAAIWGRKDVVKLLLAHGAEINAKDNLGRTPLWQASDYKDEKDVAELLLAHGAEVNAKDNFGGTPFLVAGNKQVAELLLAHGAEINVQNNNGMTPLHWAAVEGHKDVAELLLASKVEVNAKDKDGQTPLHWAATARFGENKDVVELLLDNKADVNAKDKEGMTPLHLAVENRHNDVAELLRQHGGHE